MTSLGTLSFFFFVIEMLDCRLCCISRLSASVIKTAVYDCRIWISSVPLKIIWHLNQASGSSLSKKDKCEGICIKKKLVCGFWLGNWLFYLSIFPTLSDARFKRVKTWRQSEWILESLNLFWFHILWFLESWDYFKYQVASRSYAVEKLFDVCVICMMWKL